MDALKFWVLTKMLDEQTTSQAAKDSIDTSALENLVLDTIFHFGPGGCISDQVRDRLPDLAYSSVTARFSALKKKNLIRDTGQRRKGYSGRMQTVLRATAWDLI